MPYFKTSTEWYEQSLLLLKARPSTARITSKYSVLKPSPSKISKRKKYASKHPKPATTDSATQPPQNPEDPTSTFTLKTYDPVSGVCLQYETNKAAEVGRLISTLGRLGRIMAALPEVAEDLSAPAVLVEGGSGVATPVVEKDAQLMDTKTAAGGGGGKKKKKGKK